MLKLEIPGRRDIFLEGIVFDMNGTLTVDGELAARDRELLMLLAGKLKVYVLTADTFGTAATMFAGLPLDICRLKGRTGFLEKKKFIDSRDSSSLAAVGNGYNDHLMLQSAALGICVLGVEGAHPLTMTQADLVVSSTGAALELFLHPLRLVAGLRR
ncbi:MAG: ATPase P [Pseudomonadota bacterium]|nr:ATPase P [Pseudomonadota bacterium]